MKYSMLLAMLGVASTALAAPTASTQHLNKADQNTNHKAEGIIKIDTRRQVPSPSPSSARPYTQQLYAWPSPSPSRMAIVNIQDSTDQQRDPANGIGVSDGDGAASQQDTQYELTPLMLDTPNSPDANPEDPTSDFVNPQYIASNPGAALPGPDPFNRVQIRAESPLNFLTGPCGSRVVLTKDGVLHLYNAARVMVGEFTGAFGACNLLDRAPCVMRFENGSLNIGNYALGQFHEPKFSTNSNGVVAVVVETGDVWVVRENGVVEAKLLMNAKMDLCAA